MMSALSRLLLLLAMSVLAVAGAHAQRSAPSTFDSYGYRNYDSRGPQCSYNYVDASAGTLLSLTAASGAAAASDDGGAVVNLAAPFQLYGVSGNALVASSNGYLAAASDLASEDGGDFSGDCPLPAIADNAAASQTRIYAYHADLDGAPNTGNMYAQYFAPCPRAGESGVSEACTVVQWQNWALRSQSGVLNMQAVLYHTTFEIALQYQTLDASLGSAATIGTQSDNAISGNAYSCPQPTCPSCKRHASPLTPAMAVCFFDPRYLPVSDRIFASGFETP